MTKHQNAFNANVHPSLRKIRQSNAPVYLTLIDMGLLHEAINAIMHSKEALVILAFMLIGYL
jgi:hypothetical protein